MYQLIVFLFFCAVITSEAYAYLGPGVAGGMIWATVGVIVALFAALFGLIWFPLKRLLNKRQETIKSKQDKID